MIRFWLKRDLSILHFLIRDSANSWPEITGLDHPNSQLAADALVGQLNPMHQLPLKMVNMLGMPSLRIKISMPGKKIGNNFVIVQNRHCILFTGISLLFNEIPKAKRGHQ
jgi:hypothetical protein